MNKAKERQKLSWEGMFYSIQRIDLLIVLFSGAGIYVCLESIKYLSEKNLEVHFSVKISGVMFLLSIMTNFLSQIFGYKANEQDYLMCQTEIEAGEKKSKKKKNQIKDYDKKSDRFSNLTNKLNYTSITFMFLGLLIIMLYFLLTF